LTASFDGSKQITVMRIYIIQEGKEWLAFVKNQIHDRINKEHQSHPNNAIAKETKQTVGAYWSNVEISPLLGEVQDNEKDLLNSD
jgi:hypothetical protein